MILLDTDVCIELLRGNRNVIEERKRVDSPVGVSFMTVGELFYGAEKSKNRQKNLAIVEEFLLSVQIIDSSFLVMKKFGALKVELVKAGLVLPDADILIAATSLIHCQKLITGNTTHFSRFTGLEVENWLR